MSLTAIAGVTSGNLNKAYMLLRRNVIEETNSSGGIADSALGIMSLSNALQSTIGKVTAAAGNEIEAMAEEKGYVAIAVQYNPASIQFSGLRGNQGISEHDGAYLDYDRAVETTMGMELIFDSMQESSSFMMDKTRSSAISSLISDKTYSVRHISELLVAATAFTGTRWVGFAWNEMIFWGELFNVSITYTMFDTAGEPVRAKAAIRIRQDQINVTQLDESNPNQKEIKENRLAAEKQWNKQFAALGKKKAHSNTLSNLINTNL